MFDKKTIIPIVALAVIFSCFALAAFADTTAPVQTIDQKAHFQVGDITHSAPNKSKNTIQYNKTP